MAVKAVDIGTALIFAPDLDAAVEPPSPDLVSTVPEPDTSMPLPSAA